MSSNRVQKSSTTPVGDAAGNKVSFTKILMAPVYLVLKLLYYYLIFLKWMMILNFVHIIIWNVLFLPIFIVWQPLELGGYRYPTLGAPPIEPTQRAQEWSFLNATRFVAEDLYSSMHQFASVFKAKPPSTELAPWTGPIEPPSVPRSFEHLAYFTLPAPDGTQTNRATFFQRMKSWLSFKHKPNKTSISPLHPIYGQIDNHDYTFQELVAMSLEPNDEDSNWYYTFAKMQGARKIKRTSIMWDVLLLLMNYLVVHHFLTMLGYLPHLIACLAAWQLGGADAWMVMGGVLLAHLTKWYLPYVLGLIQEEWRAITDETYAGRKARAKHIYCGMTWRRQIQDVQVQASRFGRRPLHGIEVSSVRKQLGVLEVLADLDMLRDLPYSSYIRGNFVFAYLLALELKTRSPPPALIDSAKRSMLISSCGALLKELSKEKRFEGKLDLFNDPVMKFKLITQAVAIYSIPTLEEVEQVDAMQHPVNVELRDAFAALTNGRE